MCRKQKSFNSAASRCCQTQGDQMKRKFFTTNSTKALLILVLIAPAFVAQAQPPHPLQYKLTDLGPSGNPFSQAAGVADNGLVAGFDTAPDGTSHSILWYKGRPIDISAPGLGGPNSGAGGVNLIGQ